MRAAIIAVLGLVLAGCTGNTNTLLDRGDCAQPDEDGQDDVIGTLWECTDISGTGQFEAQIRCPGYGVAGFEFQAGNGTAYASLSAKNGTFWQATVNPDSERFGFFDGNATVTFRVWTAKNFTAEQINFGISCWEDF